MPGKYAALAEALRCGLLGENVRNGWCVRGYNRKAMSRGVIRRDREMGIDKGSKTNKGMRIDKGMRIEQMEVRGGGVNGCFVKVFVWIKNNSLIDTDSEHQLCRNIYLSDF